MTLKSFFPGPITKFGDFSLGFHVSTILGTTSRVYIFPRRKHIIHKNTTVVIFFSDANHAGGGRSVILCCSSRLLICRGLSSIFILLFVRWSWFLSLSKTDKIQTTNICNNNLNSRAHLICSSLAACN